MPEVPWALQGAVVNFRGAKSPVFAVYPSFDPVAVSSPRRPVEEATPSMELTGAMDRIDHEYEVLDGSVRPRDVRFGSLAVVAVVTIWYLG